MSQIVEEITREITGIKAFVTERLDAGVRPLHEETERLKKSLGEVQEKIRDWQRQQLALQGDDGRIFARDGRLAGLDMLDLAILKTVLEERQKAGIVNRSLYEEVVRQRTNILGFLTPEKFMAWQERALKMRGTVYANAPQAALRRFEGDIGQWTRTLIDMQSKALDSATAATGGNLVPTFEAAELWLAVNLETLVLPVLQQMPMPTNPFNIPSQFGDTNWYPAEENVQITTTTPGTPRTTLTAYGLKTGVPFSDELEEDSIVALVPELRRSLVRNAAEVIDDVLLNGDTTTANGINSDGTTISKTTAGKAHWLLGFDGLIHLPLVDRTAQSSEAATAVSTALYNTALRKLGKNSVARRPGEVVYVTDVNTAIASMGITQFMTLDVAGTRATLSAGELLNVFGKPLIQSAQMRMADADGKVTDSGNATSTGRILALNTTQWRVGFRRQIMLETDREAGKGQTTLYVSFRIALAEQSGTRTAATHTSVVYHITGVS